MCFLSITLGFALSLHDVNVSITAPPLLQHKGLLQKKGWADLWLRCTHKRGARLPAFALLAFFCLPSPSGFWRPCPSVSFSLSDLSQFSSPSLASLPAPGQGLKSQCLLGRGACSPSVGPGPGPCSLAWPLLSVLLRMVSPPCDSGCLHLVCAPLGGAQPQTLSACC